MNVKNNGILSYTMENRGEAVAKSNYALYIVRTLYEMDEKLIDKMKYNLMKYISLKLNEILEEVKNNEIEYKNKIGEENYALLLKCFDNVIEDDFNECIFSCKLDYDKVSERLNRNFQLYDGNTPSTLSELVFNLLNNNDKQAWLDIGCGYGSFLSLASEKKKDDNFFGYDLSADCVINSQIRMALKKANSKITECNLLEKEEYTEKFDCIFCDIPYLGRGLDFTKYNDSNKFIYPVMPNHGPNWLYIDRGLQLLNDTGKMILVVFEGTLFNNPDKEQRKALVEQNLIEGIIKLPTKLYSYTAVSSSLVILNKNNKSNYIKFFDATDLINKGRRTNELRTEEIYSGYSNYSKCINLDVIKDNDYDLSASRYIDLDLVKLGKTIPLDECVDNLFRGSQIFASEIDEYAKNADDDNYYKLLSVGDIKDGLINKEELQKIAVDEKKFGKFFVNDGDVLISGKSTVIKVAVAKINPGEKIVATGSLLVIRCNKEKLNPYFLKVFFDSEIGRKMLGSIQTGTAIISINSSALKKLNIPDLDIDKQNEIASKYIQLQNQYIDTKNKLSSLEKQMTKLFDNELN